MKCPHCKTLRLPRFKGASLIGTRLRCKDCNNTFHTALPHTKIVTWIQGALTVHGEGYVRDSYQAFLVDTGIENVSSETYLGYVRSIIYTRNPETWPNRSSEVKTVSNALDYHNVDTSHFSVSKVTINTWGSSENENKQVKLVMAPKVITPESMASLFEESVKNFKPPVLVRSKKVHGEMMVEANILDAHFGQLSWGEETGHGDWDIHEAGKSYMEAIERNLDWMGKDPVEKIVFPIGSDFFNSDTTQNTTNSGTPMDEDTRWMKTFSRGVELIRDAIILLGKKAPVDVVCVPGNHDLSRAFYMGKFLEAWFRTSEGVSVDVSPTRYKMREYGTTLLGMTHGHGCKPEKLPGIMATLWPQSWGRTTCREFHHGHHHQDTVREFPGCKVRGIQALARPSAWSVEGGMLSRRGSQSFKYHREAGLVETMVYSPIY